MSFFSVSVSVWTDEPRHHVFVMWHNKVKIWKENDSPVWNRKVVLQWGWWCRWSWFQLGGGFIINTLADRQFELTITPMCLRRPHRHREHLEPFGISKSASFLFFFLNKKKKILYWLMKQQQLGAVMFLGSFFFYYFIFLVSFLLFFSTIEQYFSCVIPFWVWRLLTLFRWIPFSVQSEGEKIKLLCYQGLSELHILSPSQSESLESLTGHEGNRMTSLEMSLSNELKKFDTPPCCWFEFWWKPSLSHIAGF